MQSFKIFFLLSHSGREGGRGVSRKRMYVQGSTWQRAGGSSAVKGTQATPASASEPGQRAGRHFPSQENVVSFL